MERNCTQFIISLLIILSVLSLSVLLLITYIEMVRDEFFSDFKTISL